jgi:hypothetical protein
MKLLLAMFAWLCIDIPFAWWKGGALSAVMNKYSKAVIIALLVSLVVTSMVQLRRLLVVQAAAVALVTFVSTVLYRGGRMGGALGGVFDNPNDLAVNIALNWPLCLMFLLAARSPLKKMLWGIGLLVMLRGVMLTYSRSGFLALGVAVVFCLWEFGVKGKRFYMLLAALLCAAVLLVAAPRNYGKRLESIVGTDQQGDKDKGSAESRKELLVESLKLTLQHPVFGVGPGNFSAYTQSWLVTHNTYTQLSSECGIPVLVLFLLIIRRAFKNLRNVRKSALYLEDPEVKLYTGALWASLAAYLVGAFFANTADQLFPYYVVAYTTALYRIASTSSTNTQPGPALANPDRGGQSPEQRRAELAWTR